MKKTIRFRKFDEQGCCRGEIDSQRKYTVRGAMAHLEENGFRPSTVSDRKLVYCWTNGCGTNAYIL